MPSTRLELIGGVLAPPIVVLAFLIGLAQHPELDPTTDTISKLSAQGISDPWAMSTGFAIYGLLIIGFAHGLRSVTNRRHDPACIALAAHGTLMICTAIFRDDVVEWGWTTFVGALHDITGGMAFTALLFAMVLTAWATTPEQARRRRFGFAYAGLFLATGLGFLATPHWYPGYSERAFVVVGIVWVQWVTASTLVHSKRQDPHAHRRKSIQ
ncbi:MAG: DUF998 domain-containing protein [Gammaproteobacteria bacterium]|nr:DUF998 domain-containing protein [Gammaproteobacteria bacterium]